MAAALGRSADGRDLGLLSDVAISDAAHDHFEFGVFADAVAELIDNPRTTTPLSMAINARWGAGKTSVANLVETRLRTWTREGSNQRRHIVCWFNAWIHDDADNVGAALAAVVARRVNGNRPWWRRVVEPLPAEVLLPYQRWRRRLVAALVTLALAALAVALARRIHMRTSWLPSAWQQYVTGLGTFGVLAATSVAVWQKVFAFTESAAHFVSEPASEAARGSMALVRDQLGRLIHQATRTDGRLVIFVDDLERCRPPKALEVCEVTSQLLSHGSVVVVLIADMQAIATSARIKYEELNTTPGGADECGRRYLQKMVQIQLDLPLPQPGEMEKLVRREGMAAAAVDDITDAAPWRVRWQRVAARLEELRAQAPDASWKAVELVGWKFFWLGTTITLVILQGLSIDTSNSNSPGSTAAGVVLFAGLAVGTASSLHRWQARRRRRTVNRQIKLKLQDKTSQAQLESEVVGSVSSAAEQTVARKQVQSYLTNAADELQEVERVILRNPPAVPREAKRMLNHARLLTRIARQRSMFDGALTPEHLGKWIVLSNRWPEVAAEVADDPKRMAAFEGDAKAGKNKSAPPADPHLTELLKASPYLDTIVERLIHFQPAATPTPQDGAR